MSFRASAQRDFLEWLIRQLLEHYGGESDTLDPKELTTLSPRLTGQGGRAQDGSRAFTPRQNNLFARPGTSYPSVTLEDGTRIALGNTPRRRPTRPRRASGFVAVPFIPVEDDMPHQPVTHEGCVEFRALLLGQALQPVTSWVAFDSGADGGVIVG